ncbi:MAG: DUF3343 domain-containing protein [Oscillospiraceae bacterium]|nr:DUF3343 domain-containing protein [Oscillospiraceae bacterium]
MNEFLITFRSMTQAQSGQRALQSKAISAVLQRTPKSVAVQGCGYSLSVGTQQQLLYAVQELRARGILYSKVYRKTDRGALEEVVI